MARGGHNKLDRTGQRYGKLLALEDDGNGRWMCLCDCGNRVSVLSTNMASMRNKNRGCRHCANRKDIAGEKIGLLTAIESEKGPLEGRHPLWIFKCDCGNTTQGTVREFHANWLRSCGCKGDTHASWVSMMARCYDKKNVRFHVYGGRGVSVCQEWHDFNHFLKDMGERPKRHTLDRINPNGHYEPSNCQWVHISKNHRDFKNDGTATASGKAKGVKRRKSLK